MANLTTNTFIGIVRQQVAAVQAFAAVSLSFVTGSIELAFVQSIATLGIWIQSLAFQVLSLTRASTSVGTDLDTWLADYGITVRLPAVSSQGTATLSRYNSAMQAIVPVITSTGGQTIIQTADGVQFAVIADISQPYYNLATNSYILPIGIASGGVTVQAVVAGVSGNVNANTINVIAPAIPNIDTCNNALAFSNGIAQESDAAVLARFQLDLQALKQGIPAAVGASITGLAQGIQYTLTLNQTLAGVTQYGYWYVIIYPSSFISVVQNALALINPLGVTFGVFSATSLSANVAMTVTAQSGYTHANIAASVQTAIQNYIATLNLGQTLPITKLYSIAYGVTGVLECSALTVNSGTVDIVPTAQQIVIAGTVTIS